MRVRHFLCAVVASSLLSRVLAEKAWFSLWPKVVANNHKNTDTRNTEPDDHAAFEKMLEEDAINVGSYV